MIKKKRLNITIDDEIIKNMITDNINISGTVNEILKHRKNQIKTLNNLLEKIEKIELNINDKNGCTCDYIVTEIKATKPIIKDTLEYLKCKTVKKTTRVQS